MPVRPGRPAAATTVPSTVRHLGIGLWAACALAGCAPTRLAETPETPPRPSVSSAPIRRVAPATPPLANLDNLPGWREEDHLAAMAAVRASCPLAASTAMEAVCG